MQPLPEQTPSSNKRFASEYYVEGIASQFGVKYQIGTDEKTGNPIYEMIAPGALDGCDVSDVIMQYDHEGKVFARTSNNTLCIEARPDTLFMAADLSKSRAAVDMYAEIAAGLVTRMSFSFTVEKEHFDRATWTRVIDKLKKVYDVSAVSIPANASTTIDARKAVERIIETDRQELAVARRNRILLNIKISEVMK